MELRFRNKDLKIQISKSFSPKECMKLLREIMLKNEKAGDCLQSIIRQWKVEKDSANQ